MNKLQQTPTLFPSSQRDIISNHCFLFVNTGQKLAGKEYNEQQRGSGLEHHPWDLYGLNTMTEIYIICKHWLWLLFGRYKLSNILWIQSLWSSGMWHDEVWQTYTGLRGTFCLHLQGNVGGTHVPNNSDKSSEDHKILPLYKPRCHNLWRWLTVLFTINSLKSCYSHFWLRWKQLYNQHRIFFNSITFDLHLI